MGEYYAVLRTKSYLSHLNEAGGTGANWKNHKYVAKARMDNGKYRYFYTTEELVAYKKNPDNGGAAADTSSKSLRERWEERRGMLSGTGSGSGSGSGGGRGGSGSGRGGSGGGRGRSSSAQSKSASPTLISAGARMYRGENDPVTPAEIAEASKKKKKKKSKGSMFSSSLQNRTRVTFTNSIRNAYRR